MPTMGHGLDYMGRASRKFENLNLLDMALSLHQVHKTQLKLEEYSNSSSSLVWPIVHWLKSGPGENAALTLSQLLWDLYIENCSSQRRAWHQAVHGRLLLEVQLTRWEITEDWKVQFVLANKRLLYKITDLRRMRRISVFRLHPRPWSVPSSGCRDLVP